MTKSLVQYLIRPSLSYDYLLLGYHPHIFGPSFGNPSSHQGNVEGLEKHLNVIPEINELMDPKSGNCFQTCANACRSSVCSQSEIYASIISSRMIDRLLSFFIYPCHSNKVRLQQRQYFTPKKIWAKRQMHRT